MTHQRVSWFILPLTMFGNTKHFAFGSTNFCCLKCCHHPLLQPSPNISSKNTSCLFTAVYFCTFCSFSNTYKFCWLETLFFFKFSGPSHTEEKDSRSLWRNMGSAFWPLGLSFGDSVATQCLRGEGNQLVMKKEVLGQNICIKSAHYLLLPPVIFATNHQDKESSFLYMPKPTCHYCRAEIPINPSLHLLGNYWASQRDQPCKQSSGGWGP